MWLAATCLDFGDDPDHDADSLQEFLKEFFFTVAAYGQCQIVLKARKQWTQINCYMINGNATIVLV